jgi:DNA-binding NarL/FixJ family response regulator
MRFVLADDHQIVREGLRAILEREPGNQVVGEAADGWAARSAVAELRPDVLVMGTSLPGLNGQEAARCIATEHPEVKIVVLSKHSDRRHVVGMLTAGASGYVLKKYGAKELLQAIDAVTRGQTYLSAEVTASVVRSLRDPSPLPEADAEIRLSGREREVLKLLADGNTSKEIAVRLKIAVTTVDTHRRQIMDKLELRSIAALTKYAIRNGLTSVER